MRESIDRFEDDPGARLLRSALPVVPAARRPRVLPADALFAPGRAWLEGAVLFAALALVAPVCSPLAVGCAATARRRGNSHGTAALVAALWCMVLGICVRALLGFGMVP